MSYVHVVVVLLAISLMLDLGLAFPSFRARWQWPFFNQTAIPPTGADGHWPMFNHTVEGSVKIIVGGANKWRTGFITRTGLSNRIPFSNMILLVNTSAIFYSF